MKKPVLNILSFLTLLLIASSCIQDFTPKTSYVNAEIPGRPDRFEAELYAEGTVPEKDFVVAGEITVFDQQGAHNILEKKAHSLGSKLGYDGVIIGEHNTEYVTYNPYGLLDVIEAIAGDPTPPVEETATFEVLRATPFMYQENIDYLDHYVFQEHVFIYEDGSQEASRIGTITYGLNQQKLQESYIHGKYSKYYRDYLQAYDLNFLLYSEDKGWSTKLDSYERARVRRYHEHNNLKLTVRPRYDGMSKKFKYLRLEYAKTMPVEERLYADIDAKDVLRGVTVTRRDTYKGFLPLYKEEFQYDGKGRKVATTFYEYKDNAWQPLLYRSYDFYPSKYEEYKKMPPVEVDKTLSAGTAEGIAAGQ